MHLTQRFYLISGVYLLPLIGWSLLALRELPAGRGFFYLGLGWLLMGIGGFFLYSRLPLSPLTQPSSIGEPFLDEVKREREEHLKSMESLKEELRLLKEQKEKESFEFEKIRGELIQVKSVGLEAIRQREGQIQEMKKALQEHRHQIEEKQSLLQTLQHKVSDLTFEIKTIVELHNRGEDQPTFFQLEKKEFLPRESGLRILRRCVDMAKRQMGSLSFHGGEGNGNLSLDQRRLFDAFLSEQGAIVFYFSPKEGKILFVNEKVGEFVGCTPETFRFDFPKLIEGGQEIWRQGVQTLSKIPESEFHLPLKLPSGKEGLFSCTLGLISTGLFKGDVIGVLT